MRIPGLELFAQSDPIPWRESSAPGVRWYQLSPAPATGARGPREATVLIRMEPGCGYPAHRHLDVEEVLVLAGGYRDECGVHTAGSYLRYEPGSMHTPIALGDAGVPTGPNNPACLLFASARRGVELLAAESSTSAAETAPTGHKLP